MRRSKNNGTRPSSRSSHRRGVPSSGPQWGTLRSHHQPIAFHHPVVFQARHAVRRLSATHSRLVPRLVLSRLAGRLVHISDCLSMPYSLYRPVGSCSSGLARPRLIARRSAQRRYHPIHIAPPHIFIVSLYPCIFVSFIYIAYIIFIIYIHRRDMMSRTPIPEQAARRHASPSRRLKSNGRHEARAIRPGNEKHATMSQTGDAARTHAPQTYDDNEQTGTPITSQASSHRHDGIKTSKHPATRQTRREPPPIHSPPR